METSQRTIESIPGLLRLNELFVPACAISSLSLSDEALVVQLNSGECVTVAPGALKTFLHGFRASQEQLVNGNPKLLTYAQIAYRYQVEVRTVKAWVKSKRLKAIKITKRCVRFDPISCDTKLIN